MWKTYLAGKVCQRNLEDMVSHLHAVATQLIQPGSTWVRAFRARLPSYRGSLTHYLCGTGACQRSEMPQADELGNGAGVETAPHPTQCPIHGRHCTHPITLSFPLARWTDLQEDSQAGVSDPVLQVKQNLFIQIAKAAYFKTFCIGWLNIV